MAQYPPLLIEIEDEETGERLAPVHPVPPEPQALAYHAERVPGGAVVAPDLLGPADDELLALGADPPGQERERLRGSRGGRCR